MPKTTYHADSVLTQLKNLSPRVGLLTEKPVSATSYTEVTGSGYTRPNPTFGTPSGGVMSNTTELNFGAGLINQSIKYIGIFDAATAGNLLRYYALSGDEWVIDGYSNAIIGVGNLIIKEA